MPTLAPHTPLSTMGGSCRCIDWGIDFIRRPLASPLLSWQILALDAKPSRDPDGRATRNAVSRPAARPPSPHSRFGAHVQDSGLRALVGLAGPHEGHVAGAPAAGPGPGAGGSAQRGGGVPAAGEAPLPGINPKPSPAAGEAPPSGINPKALPAAGEAPAPSINPRP